MTEMTRLRDILNFRLYDAVIATAIYRRERRTTGSFALHAAVVQMWRQLAKSEERR